MSLEHGQAPFAAYWQDPCQRTADALIEGLAQVRPGINVPLLRRLLIAHAGEIRTLFAIDVVQVGRLTRQLIDWAGYRELE